MVILARLDKKTDLFHMKLQPRLSAGSAEDELDELGKLNAALAASNGDLPGRVLWLDLG